MKGLEFSFLEMNRRVQQGVCLGRIKSNMRHSNSPGRLVNCGYIFWQSVEDKNDKNPIQNNSKNLSCVLDRIILN